MQRIRLSTWVLTAIFLAALVAYLLVKPSSAAIISPQQAPGRHTQSTSPVRGTLLPGVIPGASPRSSAASTPPAASSTHPAR
jgi:hypothetical protein